MRGKWQLGKNRWLSLSKPEGVTLFILIFSFSVFSCTRAEKEEKETVESTVEEKKEAATIEPELERTEVRWMYMDDSLRNICRPLNLILPWMGSSEMEIPDTVYHEITRLAAFNYFSPIGFDKQVLNDTVVSFGITLMNAKCTCEVIRYYRGNKEKIGFDGYAITEQVICSAKDKSPNQ